MPSDTSITAPADAPVIVISRTVAAPRDLVFRCYTDPVHVVQFWGPHGSAMPVCEMDLRPGGVWRQMLRFPGMAEFPVTSVFLEIVPPERIVFRDAPHDTQFGDPLPPPGMISSIELEALDDGRTRIVSTVRFPSIAARDATAATDFAKVVGEAGERLERYLAEL